MFLGDIGYNAAGHMHLDDLDQPFEVVVSAMHLLHGGVLEKRFYHVETVTFR